MVHGRNEEAEEIVAEVERNILGGKAAGIVDPGYIKTLTRIRTRTHTPWREIWDAIAYEHRWRSFLGFVLMSTQAFFYNAIFFTYALVLMRFYGVPEQNVGSYLLPFALGNVLGPLLLGHLFDTIGRKKMITLTYGLAGVLLALTGWLFHAGLLTAQTQTLAWTIIFFIIRRSQFGIPDCERNFPAGNPRGGDRNFLCNRNAHRWRRCTVAFCTDH